MIVLTDAEAEAIRTALADGPGYCDPAGGVCEAAIDRSTAASAALYAATERAKPPEGRRLLLHLAPPMGFDLLLGVQQAVLAAYPEVGEQAVGATMGTGDEVTGIPIWIPA